MDRAENHPPGFVYNDRMKVRPRIAILSVIIALGLCVGGYSLYDRGRPAPVPLKQKLFEGVEYQRVIHVLPHPMIAHVLKIDTKRNGASLLVTPPDSESETPLNARTT